MNESTIKEILDTAPSYNKLDIPSRGIYDSASFTLFSKKIDKEIEYRMIFSRLPWNMEIVDEFLSINHLKISKNAVDTLLVFLDESEALLLFFAFDALVDGKRVTFLTGTGNVGTVFSNVSSYMSEIVKKNNDVPLAILFSGKEEGRQKLYQTFYDNCSKFVPGLLPIQEIAPDPKNSISMELGKEWVVGNERFRTLRKNAQMAVGKAG